MVGLLEKIWSKNATTPVKRAGAPASHPSLQVPIGKGTAGRGSNSSSSSGRSRTSNSSSRSGGGSGGDGEGAEGLLVDTPGSPDAMAVLELPGADGVLFSMTSTDPAGYENHPFTLRSRRRTVYDALFRVIYNHMVLERVLKRYPEMSDALPEVSVDAQVNNVYELGARLHEWELSLSGGFGSPRLCTTGAQPPWLVELDAALLELKRLATHGPHPDLVDTAVKGYIGHLTGSAGSGAWQDNEDLVAELHDDLDGGFEYRTPEHRLEEEGLSGLLNPAVIDEALVNHIQAEAVFMWKGC
jgi:hypothetical protein